MPRKFKQARLINNLKMTEAAGKPGISQPTLSAWEGERKSPSVDSPENMADLYGTTTDYLLGRAEHEISDPSKPIPQESLLLFHEKPVWSAEYGWMARLYAQFFQYPIPDFLPLCFQFLHKGFA